MQVFQWDTRDRTRAGRHAPYKFHAFDFSRPQNLKPHDDESEDGGYESDFKGFAEELDSNW